MASHQRSRKVVIVAVGLLTLVAFLLLAPLILKSHKSVFIGYILNARQVGIALCEHRNHHGEWPPTLKAIDSRFAVQPELLTYPTITNPSIEMQELPDEYPTEQWLYFPPRSEDPSHIVLAAPLPFKRSNDKMVRIIVRADTTTSTIDELSFGRAIEKQFQTEQDSAHQPATR